MWVDADHGRDFYPLVDHITKLKISPRKKIINFQQFVSLQLMLEQALTNLIVCLMISQKLQRLHKRASMLQWILGRFRFLQNELEMRLAKKQID